MTQNEYEALEQGDLVKVSKSGKVYRVGLVSDKYPYFWQQRDGRGDYGPVRHLKPESIERA